jgi:hypothetical protein
MLSYSVRHLLLAQNDSSLSNILALSVPDEGYSSNVSCAINLIFLRFYYYHWVDTSASGLLVTEGIIHPVVSVSALNMVYYYMYVFITITELIPLLVDY